MKNRHQHHIFGAAASKVGALLRKVGVLLRGINQCLRALSVTLVSILLVISQMEQILRVFW
jgi:hypothetical protein